MASAAYLQRQIDKAAGMKVCPRCHERLPVIEFKLRSNGNPEAYCRPCQADYYSKYLQSRTEEQRAYKRAWRYGLSSEDFDQMLSDQNSCCAACGDQLDLTVRNRKTSVHIDHDHTSGKVRGLLCNYCNLALGHAQDSVSRLQSLIEYLRKTDAS